MMEAQLVDEDDRPLLLGRAWAMRRRAEPLDLGAAPLSLPDPPPGPAASRTFDHLFAEVDFEDFAGTALETREAEGTAQTPGPATLWLRHRQPIVDGEIATGTQRLIAAADCANGASWVADPATTLFINVDLTMYLWREPVGEWFGLRSTTHWSPEGRGASDSELFDLHGAVGRSNQGLFIERRP
jgi:hypothetical protein